MLSDDLASEQKRADCFEFAKELHEERQKRFPAGSQKSGARSNTLAVNVLQVTICGMRTVAGATQATSQSCSIITSDPAP